jgi:hypothetical protein
MCWNFPKFHDVIHIPLWIILFGWIENFSGQAGERAHGEVLKALAGCINNQHVFKQYLRFWERVEQLSSLVGQDLRPGLPEELTRTVETCVI